MDVDVGWRLFFMVVGDFNYHLSDMTVSATFGQIIIP